MQVLKQPVRIERSGKPTKAHSHIVQRRVQAYLVHSRSVLDLRRFSVQHTRGDVDISFKAGDSVLWNGLGSVDACVEVDGDHGTHSIDIVVDGLESGLDCSVDVGLAANAGDKLGFGHGARRGRFPGVWECGD